jgi:hypothetical protein
MSTDDQKTVRAALMEAVAPFKGRLNSPEARSEIIEAMLQAIRPHALDRDARYAVREDGLLEISETGPLSWEEATRRVLAMSWDPMPGPVVTDMSTEADREDGVMRFSIRMDPDLAARIKAREEMN